MGYLRNHRGMKIFLILLGIVVVLAVVVLRNPTFYFIITRIGAPPTLDEEVIAKNEQRCIDAGWAKVSMDVEGIERRLFWKGPVESWKGSIIVMHGGGGDYTQWCYESRRLVKPQVDFSNLAVDRGFGVFLLDSTDDVVTDSNGLSCGKRFDATVVDGRSTNVDLPFIERVITETIPQVHPRRSSHAVFLTGESIGGYMTTRAATHFDGLVTAFAPAASGDPYGTYFDCNPSLSPRKSAKGVGFDRETGKKITASGACAADAYPNERQWETMDPPQKPTFKTFHHEGDAVADISCREKVAVLLHLHGYSDDGAFVIPRTGRRSVQTHLWQSEYNIPILDFFEKHSE